MIRQTSILAFQNIQNKISKRQALIMDVLSQAGDEGMTDQEIARKLKKSDPNYVRPRRNELCKMGLVIGITKRVCLVSTGTSIAWKVR